MSKNMFTVCARAGAAVVSIEGGSSHTIEAVGVCPAHRAWVRRHRCSVPKCFAGPVECAHVRSGTHGGCALKPSDRWTISLCRHHHAEQHRIGEAAFERRYALRSHRRWQRCSPGARHIGKRLRSSLPGSVAGASPVNEPDPGSLGEEGRDD